MEIGVPPGWLRASIGELATKVTDGSHNPPPKRERGCHMLSARNIDDGRIDLDGRYISLEDFIKEDARTQVRPGDVLLTTVGTIGRSAVVRDHLPPITLQRSVSVIGIPEIDPDFVSFQIRSPGFQALLKKSARGTAQKGVYLKTLASLPLDVAPLPEQRRIVARIEESFSELDAGTKALERAQAKLERYRASVLKAAVEGRLTEAWRRENPPEETGPELLERILAERRARWEEGQLAKYEAKGKKPPKNWQAKYQEPIPPDTSQLPELPKRWCWASLDQLVSTMRNGTTAKQNRDLMGVAVSRIETISSGRIDFRRVRHVADPPRTVYPRHLLEPGDLLLSHINSPSHVGKTAQYESEMPELLHGMNLMLLRPVTPGLSPYLHLSCRYLRMTGSFMRVAQHAVNQASVNQRKLKALPCALPPDQEWRRIVAVVDALESRVGRVVESIGIERQRVDRLRQAILHRAFEGRLVPQHPDDEPASVLLERIRVEREAAPPTKKKRRAKNKAAQPALDL